MNTRFGAGYRRSGLSAGVALAMALVGGAVLSGLPGQALAQPAGVAQQYDIAAQPLANALNQLAIQSGVEIMVAPDLARGLRAPELKGRYDFETAMGKLLEGSGLSWKRAKGGLVTVSKEESRRPAPRRQVDRKMGPVPAQPVTDMPELLVRGARSLNADIRRTVNDPQPYVVFDRRDIERSGAISINDFMLKRVSANNMNASPSQTGNAIGERSSIDLRGLGEGQTLILIDGRRAAPTYAGVTPGQQNLNGIPLAAVERIEILPTTASAIYGGSATGGVVNVILRRDYQGGEVAVSHDNSFDTDSSINRVDFSYGFNVGEKTTALINGSYSEANMMRKGDRDFRVRGYEHMYNTDSRFLAAALALSHQSTSPNIASQTGANLTLLDGTALGAPITHVPKGYLGPGSDGAAALVANAGRFNSEQTRNGSFTNGGASFGAVPRSKSISVSFRHSFTERLDGFLDLFSSEVRSKYPGAANTTFNLPAGHAFNPFREAIRVAVPYEQFNYMAYQGNDVDRASMGLIARIGKDWAGALDFTWSKSTNFYDHQANVLNLPGALADGFNPLVDYFNLGGRSLQPYVLAEGGTNGPSSAYSYNPTARFSGPLWHLPGGSMSASFLLEQQRIEFAPRVSSNYLGSTQYESFQLFPRRSQDVRSAYAEVVMPFVGEANARAGLRALDVQLAIRHDDYKSVTGDRLIWRPLQGQARPEHEMTSNSAAETTGLLGLKYSPLAGLVFRASHGTGFVPPDVTQLGAPLINENSLNAAVFDPRRGNTVNPSPYVLVSQGNPNLGPEKSKTTSLGVIVEPQSVPGLRVSLDYTRLQKTDNIRALPAALLLEYEEQFPDRVRRGPNLPTDPPGWAGPIVYLDTSFINAAAASYENLDAQIKYGFDLSNGTYIELWGTGTWTLKAEQQTITGGPTSNVRGITQGYGARAPLGFRGFYGVNVERSSWMAGWAVRHYSSYLVADPDLGGSASMIAAQGNGGRVPRQMVHDVWGSWRPSGLALGDGHFGSMLSRLEISGGIRNVLNTKPEVDLSNDYDFYSYLVDARLRTYYLQAKYSF